MYFFVYFSDDPKNGFLDNNNLKNINFANELNFE